MGYYQVNTSPDQYTIESDSTIGNTIYYQDWTASETGGTTFRFRYRCDIYVYAYYTADEFTITYYVPNSNKVGNVNTLSNYSAVTGLATSYTTVAFNALYSTLATVLEGHTFLGWYVSYGEPLTSFDLSSVSATSEYFIENRG